ncbi:MAG: hypothetical protein JW841_03725 [Deltaproteobacteria bacterium]|nr:hypothetical protein [Deltaproteobacteria bacterium]
MLDIVNAYLEELFILLPRFSLLFIYALLFALVEIEIEGKNGWAANLPTWFRRTPWYARIFAFVLSGKPLTGYHMVMFLIPFFSFHLGLAFGQSWSWGFEIRVVTTYLVWNATWDFLWFLLNPHYGWSRFHKGMIWWHNGIWLGRLPIDYIVALGASVLLAAIPWLIFKNISYILYQVSYIIFTVAAIILIGYFAPLYQRWYHYMRSAPKNEVPLRQESLARGRKEVSKTR